MFIGKSLFLDKFISTLISIFFTLNSISIAPFTPARSKKDALRAVATGIARAADVKGALVERSGTAAPATDAAARLEERGAPASFVDENTKIKFLRNREDFPGTPEIRAAWDRHYAVFEVENLKLGYTAYIAMHDLVKIESRDERVNGKFMCIGGLRKQHYANDLKEAKLLALADALRLSSAMTFKNSLVIPIGGGKTAVHIHNFDPQGDREQDREARDAISRHLMLVYDRINRTLGGNGLFVAEDQNMTVRDMEIMYRAIPDNPWVLPNSDPANNKHPSSYTVLGVVKGMEKAVPFVPGWEGDEDQPLKGKVVAVQGIGNIGKELVTKLLERGAKVVASDTRREAYEAFIQRKDIQLALAENRLFIFQEDSQLVGDIYDPFGRYGEKLNQMGITSIDIFSPNGPPLVINATTIPLLQQAGVKMVAGSTNNPLSTDGPHARSLLDADILYVADWVINSSGVQAVAGTRYFMNGNERRPDMETITDNTAYSVKVVLKRWDAEGRKQTTLDVAYKLSEENRARLTHARRPETPQDLAAVAALETVPAVIKSTQPPKGELEALHKMGKAALEAA